MNGGLSEAVPRKSKQTLVLAREGAAGTEWEGAQGGKWGTVPRGAGSLSEARAGTRVGSVSTAQEWGKYQSRWALTEAAHTGCAHHWPAYGWQGCSTWEVTSSLSRGHREGKCMGGKEGKGDGVGRRPLSPGYPGRRSQKDPNAVLRGQIPQGGAYCTPALGVPHSLWGPSHSAPLRDTGTQGPPTASLTHPLCQALAEAAHHALGSLAPHPHHPHLHLHLSAGEEDRGLAPHSSTLVPHGRGQPHFLQAQDGVCGPEQLKACAPPSSFPIILSHWPGLALGGESR